MITNPNDISPNILECVVLDDDKQAIYVFLMIIYFSVVQTGHILVLDDYMFECCPNRPYALIMIFNCCIS